MRGAAQGPAGLPARLATSGRTQIDDICVKEVASLNRLFEVEAAFGFFDDADGANAVAIQKAYDPARKDGTVLLGRRLAEQIARRHDKLLSVALIGVLAHEWGHIRQFKAGVQASWGVHYELSADYLAGWYLARMSLVGEDRMDEGSRLFENLGDSQFMDEDHHGTPAQRSKMFAFAYKYSSSDGIADALSNSLNNFN